MFQAADLRPSRFPFPSYIILAGARNPDFEPRLFHFRNVRRTTTTKRSTRYFCQILENPLTYYFNNLVGNTSRI